MKRLCSICARGGSKGVTNKNLRLVAGRPLIAHSIAQALATGLFDAVAVSSDSPQILAAAKEAGATLVIERPAEMASDTAAKVPAIRHCLETAEARAGLRFDTLVDLDATSPLRLPADIVGAVALLESSDAPNVITGSPSRRSPYFNLVERRSNGSVAPAKTPPAAVVRRQDAPATFDMNASIYVWRRDAFLADPRVFYDATLLFEMPEERSLDIDSELDFTLVSFLMEKRQHHA